jgi:septation ring formation regulator EzrA
VVGGLVKQKSLHTKSLKPIEEELEQEQEPIDQDMTLTQMADSLVGSESHFSKSLENSLEQYASLKESLNLLEQEVSKKQMDQVKIKKTVESTKSKAESFMTHLVQIFEEIMAARKNLHKMIEEMAEREQTTDLREFLRRESEIPKHLNL